jgi:Fe2+ transport system protein B
LPLIDSIRVLSDDTYLGFIKPYLNPNKLNSINTLVKNTRSLIRDSGINLSTLESEARYNYIDNDLSPAFSHSSESEKTFSEKIDYIISHPVFGSLIFIALLGLIFNTIFSWAQYPMDLITSGIGLLSTELNALLPSSVLKSLLIDGIISGVGIETIALIIILILALSYVFRHIHRTLSVGEDDKCTHCPINKNNTKISK